MKRRLLWLALPLVLAAIMLGVKWRADHPTPTKEDLKFQKSLSRPYSIGVVHYRNQFKNYSTSLSAKEFEPFAEQFFLLSPANRSNLMSLGAKGLITIHCLPNKPFKRNALGVVVMINPENTQGRASDLGMQARGRQNLHPLTVKRWMELLLANPRVGPELRKRLNP